MSSTNSSKCFFLDSLPPELRLNVYGHLVIAEAPIQGRRARKGHCTGLDLAILRVNRQIHEEAKAVYLGKNVFHVCSAQDAACAESSQELQSKPDMQERGWCLEPAFRREDLKHLRHLVVDLISRADDDAEKKESATVQQPMDSGAAYIRSLTTLLQSTQLRTLHLTAIPPPHLTAQQNLSAFFTLDRNPAFATAISTHPLIEHIPISFEFPDCYYYTSIHPKYFTDSSILLLACRVMFCQSKVRVQRIMKEYEEGIEMEEGCVGRQVRVDLAPLVAKWPEAETGMLFGEMMREVGELEDALGEGGNAESNDVSDGEEEE